MYLYVCSPHKIMGMYGAVIVLNQDGEGEGIENLDKVKEYIAKKKRLEEIDKEIELLFPRVHMPDIPLDIYNNGWNME